MAAEDEAAGAGLVNHAQLDTGLREFLEELVDGVEGAADDAIAASVEF